MPFLAGQNAVNHRQYKGSCFAGSRLRTSDQVATLQNDRDGLLLDGRGVTKAHGIQAIQQIGVEIKVVKCHPSGEVV